MVYYSSFAWRSAYFWLTCLILLSCICESVHAEQIPLGNVDELSTNESFKDRAHRILEMHPLIDGHNDLLFRSRMKYGNQIYNGEFEERFTNGSLEGQTDLPKIKEGHYGGAFWSAFFLCQDDIFDFSDAAYDKIVKGTLQQLDLYGRIAELFPDLFPTNPSGRHYTPTADYARKHFESGHLISPLAIEGLHQIGNSPSTLRLYHALGARYATLTWNCHNIYADAAVLTFIKNWTSIVAPPMHHGISRQGRALVHEMNRLGMLVDLAHVSANTMRDALAGSSDDEHVDGHAWRGSIAPPFFSHSSAYAVCPHPRNVPDDVLELVKERNSVVMVNFSPDFVSCRLPDSDNPTKMPVTIPEEATLEKVADHIMHIGKTAGFDHVGIGSDFDGIASVPKGLEDVSKMPDLVAELLRRGVCEADMVKVIGGNVLRVWNEADKVGRNLRASGMEPLEDEDFGLREL